MKRKIWMNMLLAFTVGGVMAQENLEINGFIRNYTGVLLEEPNEFSILQNTLELKFAKSNEQVGFKFNPYLYHYNDNKIELGIREAYMDMFIGNLDFRIGKQQIIWGKADGVFITDIVSPKDLREFLLPDFQEIRVGITSLKSSYHINEHTLDIVWAPYFKPTQMPDDNSIWKPEMVFPISPKWDYSTSVVNASLDNSELYTRYSYMGQAFDFELVAGSFFYDDPAMHISKQINPVTQTLTQLNVRPEYHRVNMGGGSFSVPIGDLVIRGEGAWYDGRLFQTSNPAYSDATIEKNFVNYMAGVDYTIGGVKLSAQYIRESIMGYESGITNREHVNMLTFLAKKDFFREKVWLEIFSYVGLDDEDALIRPRISYTFADGYDIQAGANLFVGETGRFGQYNNNDMLYFKFKYSF